MNAVAPARLGSLPLPSQWGPSRIAELPPFFLFLRSGLGTWGFALRMALSAMLALLTAFYLQLESPFWAMTTVVILASPVRGKILSKSAFRLLGTSVGAAVAVVLAALFAQTPELYILCMAVWIGLCTAASNLLRRFHSYATVLAGYSAAIIGFFVVIYSPLMVFDSAMARMAAITVGIVSSAVVSTIFAPGGAVRDLEVKVRFCGGNMAALIRQLLEKGPFPAFSQAHRKLVIQALSIEEIIDAAALEAAHDVNREKAARFSAIHLTHCLTAIGALAHNLEKLPASAQGVLDEAARHLNEATAELYEVLDRPDFSVEGGRNLQCRTALRLLEESLIRNPSSDSIQVMACLNRMNEIASHMEWMAHYWRRFHQDTGEALPALPPIAYHRDYKGAAINGVRTTLIVLLCAAFWIATASHYGEQLIFVVTANCCLVCSRPNPAAASLGFLYGSLWVLIPCFVFNFFLMPYLTSPVLLAFFMGLMFLPGFLALGAPAPMVAATGMSYLIFFCNQVSPLNHTLYDVVLFLNSGLMLVTANVVTILVFNLILPVRPGKEVERLLRTFLRDVRMQARTDVGAVPRSVWETRMYDRMLRLISQVGPSGERSEKLLRAAFGLLQIGTDIIELRGLLRSQSLEPQIHEAIRQALRAVAELGNDFEGQMNVLGESLLHLSAGGNLSSETRREQWRAASAVHEIVHLLTHHHEFIIPHLRAGEAAA